LKIAAGTGALAAVPAAFANPSCRLDSGAFARAASRPVLRRELFDLPVKIESIELLRNGNVYFVRTRTGDGAEGIAAAHSLKMASFYPIFLRNIAPGFLGEDARNLERLIASVYVRESNYKMQGQAFWVCLASLEFSLLDLLGNIARKPVGGLFGDIVRTSVAVYQASNRRGNSPEDEVDRLARAVGETGVKAVKVRLGGRMSNNADSLPGRTEALIPLARKVLGDTVTLYGDANGSYDVPHAIRIGKLMEEHGYAFFEEPCPFDHYDETREVAEDLEIPIAGGECEASLRQFQWMLEHDVLQVVQPDLFYFGGFIRSIRVARMAAVVHKPCTIQISGGDLGYLYMLHFASCVPDIGPFQEFKRETKIPLTESGSLMSTDGIVRIPSGPGLGVTIDPLYLSQSHIVRL